MCGIMGCNCSSSSPICANADDFPFQLENLYLIIFILPPDKYVQASIWNLAEHRQLPDIVD